MVFYRCFFRDLIKFPPSPKTCREVLSSAFDYNRLSLHLCAPLALQDVCARIGWVGLEGPRRQIGHRPITLLADAESLVLLLLFLRLSHGNSCKFPLAAESKRKWFGMHHNKQEHNHHLLAISNSDSEDPAFLEGNLQNAHNSKVLNIPNIFLGVLSIASSWKAHYRVANLPTELGCQLWSDSKCLVNYQLLFVCIQSVADTATGSCDFMSQKVALNFPNSSCNYILDTCLKL